MSRATRIEFDGAIYHVMSRAISGMRISLDREDNLALLDLLGRAVSGGDMRIHAFCLMPNHYHMLCETPRGHLGRLVHDVNGGHAQRFNKVHRRVGYLWQGRYKAILVQEGAYFLECSRYIHLNPVRSRMDTDPLNYPWSSYRNFVGGLPCADWVTVERTLDLFGGDRARYKKFVESGNIETWEDPLEMATAGLVLGDRAFVDDIRQMVSGRESRGQPSLAQLRKPGCLPPQHIEQAVRARFSGMGKKKLGRLLLYAQRRYSGLSATAVAEIYGKATSAVSMAVRAIEAEIRSDKDLASELIGLEQDLQGHRK